MPAANRYGAKPDCRPSFLDVCFEGIKSAPFSAAGLAGTDAEILSDRRE
jgi:hypothetical protein